MGRLKGEWLLYQGEWLLYLWAVAHRGARSSKLVHLQTHNALSLQRESWVRLLKESSFGKKVRARVMRRLRAVYKKNTANHSINIRLKETHMKTQLTTLALGFTLALFALPRSLSGLADSAANSSLWPIRSGRIDQIVPASLNKA